MIAVATTLFPSLLPGREDDEPSRATDRDDGPTDQTDGTTAPVADADGCPWCSDYEGDAVGKHASKAHPDEWADHMED